MKIVIPENLLDRCSKREPAAQMELYSLLFRTVYSSSLRITGDTNTAQEITQDSFLKVFNDFDRFRPTLPYVVSRIAINASIDLLRRRRVSFVEFSSQSDIAEQDEPHDENNYTADVEAIKQAIAQLPTGYRLTITLRLIEDLTFEEIAAELGVAESTARSQFIRAKKKIIEILTKR